jgi:hypothetical protein
MERSEVKRKVSVELGKILYDRPSSDEAITPLERIVCSAIRWKAKPHHEYTNVCGFRHNDCYNVMQGLMPHIKFDDLPGRESQGFLTSHNRFVDRSEGYKIARDAKQLLLGDYQQTEPFMLTSEDLY